MELMLFTCFMSFFVHVMFFVSSPYLLMSGLMCISILMCLMISFYISTFISFIIFLMYVGGIQILFLYSLSVVPKEDYSNWKLCYSALYFFLFIFDFLMMLTLPFISCSNSLSSSMDNGPLLVHFMSMSSLFFLFVFMIFILLYLMLVVCNLCNKQRVPLRKTE